MKILIIEPNSNGHRFQYLVWVARAFLQQQHEIVVSTSVENSTHASYLDIEAEFPSRIHMVPVTRKNGKKPFLAREVSNWYWYRKSYLETAKTFKVDFVFTTYMDDYFYSMAFLGSPFSDASFSGIIMAPTFHHRKSGVKRPKKMKDIFEKALFTSCFRPACLKTIFTIDPYLCSSEYANEKLAYLPDPSSVSETIPQSEARQMLSLGFQGKAILVFGGITGRKGIDILLNAVADFDIDIHVLIVGCHDQTILALLGSDVAKLLLNKNRLTSINDYVPSNLETAYYSASDIIWLGYKEHYAMSGVLVKAASCDKDILACKEGLIGVLTETHQLGVTTNTSSVEPVGKALNHLLNAKTEFNKSIRKEFAKQHEVDKFNDALITQYF